WIKLAPAIAAKSYQRQGYLSFAISTSRHGRCSAEDVSQQNINQLRSKRTDSRPPPPAWCLRRNRCSSTFRNFLYSGRTSVGRRVPVGAKRLSACAKTFSNSRDAFITRFCCAINYVGNPKAKICVPSRRRVRCPMLRTADTTEQLSISETT